jgi:hypothetical protein
MLGLVAAFTCVVVACFLSPPPPFPSQSVVLMSHLGRPDGRPLPEFTLAPVAACLQVGVAVCVLCCFVPTLQGTVYL